MAAACVGLREQVRAQMTLQGKHGEEKLSVKNEALGTLTTHKWDWNWGQGEGKERPPRECAIWAH